jgi:predicted O-linked N-acetylglucosamine transferase (SPINDLY family)
MTSRLRSHVDGGRDIVGLSDAQAAELIRQDRIDVLVDLTMHMANNRLLVFARKPAPVQVTYLAYCSSTGLEAMDYRVSDPYLDPFNGAQGGPIVTAQGGHAESESSCYSEQTIRLPETYWCYAPNSSFAVAPGPALERGYITFGCLNNFCKVSPPALAAWAKLLRAVPSSQLLLHSFPGSHRQQARELLGREGVDPERLRFVAFTPRENYFDLYGQIDIALDPFPYGGGTTTCDALWMGVPVVSLSGKRAVGRGGLSILSNIGLPELAAGSEEQYIQTAQELANDPPRLDHLRSTLRQRMLQSPLMDAPRYARHVEEAYRHMWRRWCLRGS